MSSIYEEEPPLLEDDCLDITNSNSNAMEKNNPESDATVMEEMMKVAIKAKGMKKKEIENAKKNFGSGFKKGFFNNNSNKTKKSQSKPTTSSAKEKIPTVKAPQQSNQQESTFVFPEVQEALNQVNSLNPQEWMNKEFFDKLSREPRIALALQNPFFTQAIEDMQKDPRAAIEKYKNNPEVTKMLQDFMAFLGGHLEEMGKTRDKPHTQAISSENQPEKIVDIQEKQREAIEKMERSPEEEEQVQKILQSPDLMDALSDSNFMSNLKKCQQTPEELQKFMRDPVYGPKLRLLLEAGLVSFS